MDADAQADSGQAVLPDLRGQKMKRMPSLIPEQKNIKMTMNFLGYDHNQVLLDGEMYDMKNLSGDQYPALTIRKKRAWQSYKHGSTDDPLTGIDGRDKLTFCLGEKVYWNFTEVTGLTVSADSSMCPKQIVNFGAYVLIYPDKKYFNTINLSDYGTIDRLYARAGESISLCMCRGDGTDYDMSEITVSATAPDSPANGKLWIDQSGDVDVLRQWTTSTNEWVEVATTFVKISGEGIGTGLNIYDAITLSGLEAVSTASDKVKSQVDGLNGSKIVYFGGTGYIVVAGLLSQTQAALKTGTTVRADRKVPDLDYIVESNNRLWGCRYGLLNGQVVNEIHASALGDFRNWERYLGNSQDSYTASVGTDGPFTGAVTQKGYPVFFKENCIHQVYGSTPSSFQINTTMCRGIQLGSARSAVVVNEQVYYKSRKDVMVYDGSMPVSVSEKLGDVLYSNARAGALGDKYYINMKDRSGVWTLFTYNTKRRVWYKEDHFHALGFGTVEDELYAIDEDNNVLTSMTANTGDLDMDDNDYPSWTVEDAIEWSATFGIQGVEYTTGRYNNAVRNDINGSEYMSRFDIRMYLEPDAIAELWIRYDDREWEKMGEIRGHSMKTFLLPVVPKRCDHLQFKLNGRGDMRIYSIGRHLEVGSDGGTY